MIFAFSFQFGSGASCRHFTLEILTKQQNSWCISWQTKRSDWLLWARASYERCDWLQKPRNCWQDTGLKTAALFLSYNQILGKKYYDAMRVHKKWTNLNDRLNGSFTNCQFVRVPNFNLKKINEATLQFNWHIFFLLVCHIRNRLQWLYFRYWPNNWTPLITTRSDPIVNMAAIALNLVLGKIVT